jgi:hypothetical protein
MFATCHLLSPCFCNQNSVPNIFIAYAELALIVFSLSKDFPKSSGNNLSVTLPMTMPIFWLK